MRNLFLTAVLGLGMIFNGTAVTAQTEPVRVLKIEKVLLPADEKGTHASISPSGEKLAFLSFPDKILKVYDRTTQHVYSVSSTANPGLMAFSGREDCLIFQNLEGFQAFRFSTGETEEVTAEKVRNYQHWGWWFRLWRFERNDYSDVDPDAIQWGALQLPCVNLRDGKIIYYNGKREQEIDPLQTRYYLYPSLSPDQTKICAYAVGKGTFSCGINGENPVIHGLLEAPVWINNVLIVGMKVSDDGHTVTSSSIEVINTLTQATQTLLTADKGGRYPSVVHNKNEVVCNDSEGNFYLIGFEVNDKR